MLPSHPGSKLKGIAVTRKAACFAVACFSLDMLIKKYCGYAVLVTILECTVSSKIWKIYIYSPKDLPLVEKTDISCNVSLIKDTTLISEEPLFLNNTKQLLVVTNQFAAC